MVPRYADHYRRTDQRPHYAYLKKVLQILTYRSRDPQGNAPRWVLKCPQHLEQLPLLRDTFGDATFVVTHRDPVAVLQSTVTMLGYAQRMNRHRVESGALLEYWAERIERLLRACVRDRECLPEARSLDVPFHQFMADDTGTVEQIYRRAKLPRTDRARALQDAFVRAHPRGKNGRLRYDLAPFGADLPALRRRFGFYQERFDVQAEV